MKRLARNTFFFVFPVVLCLLTGVKGNAQIYSEAIHFNSFETEVVNKALIRLKWSVSGDLSDSLVFKIERSSDGKVFQSLYQMSIFGTHQQDYYQYTDPFFSPDSNFYRITEVSRGEPLLSDIRKIYFPRQSKAQITIMPNPVFNNASLIINDEGLGDIFCQLYDMNGKSIRSYQVRKTGVYMQQILDMYSIPKGEYILIIRSSSINESRRILKQ